MAFPSNSPVDTMDRFRAENDLHRSFLSPNLLVNSGFHHIDWRDEDLFDFGTVGSPEWLRYAPGWFPFGTTTGEDRGVNFSATPVTDSPFGPRSGISWDQALGRVAGVYQELPNPALIRGRRVRVAGAYYLSPSVGETDVTSGISVWLMGKKRSRNVPFGDWVASAGGNYDSIDLAVDDQAVLAVLPGLGAAWDSQHPVNIPLYDLLREEGGVHLYLSGGEGSSQRGSATAHNVTVFTLEDAFSGVPATDGSFELYTESFESSATGGLNYFEAYVDVPDDDDLFEDGVCHIVVLSSDGQALGSMDNPTTGYKLYALTLEVVLDDVTASHRVLHGALKSQMSPLPYGDGTGRLSTSYLLRNPIYVPEVYPLIQGLGVSAASVSGGGTLGEVWWDLSSWTDAGVRVGRYYRPGAEDNFYFASTPLVPPGASVVRAAADVQSISAAGRVKNARVYGWPAYHPSPGSDPNILQSKVVVDLGLDETAGGFFHLEATARRNRCGLYWNESTGNSLLNGTLGAGEHLFGFETESAANNVVFRGGWLLVAADPRLRHASFLPERSS